MDKTSAPYQELVSSFEFPEKKDLARLKPGSAILRGSPNNLSTLAVYRILRNCFGPPQESGDLDKVSWWFTLKGPRTYLFVHDWKLFDWSIGSCHFRDEEIGFVTRGGRNEFAMQDAKLLLSLLTEIARKVDLKIVNPPFQSVQNVFLQSYTNGIFFIDQMKKKEEDLNKEELKKSANEMKIDIGNEEEIPHVEVRKIRCGAESRNNDSCSNWYTMLH